MIRNQLVYLTFAQLDMYHERSECHSVLAARPIPSLPSPHFLTASRDASFTSSTPYRQPRQSVAAVLSAPNKTTAPKPHLARLHASASHSPSSYAQLPPMQPPHLLPHSKPASQCHDPCRYIMTTRHHLKTEDRPSLSLTPVARPTSAAQPSPMSIRSHPAPSQSATPARFETGNPIE